MNSIAIAIKLNDRHILIGAVWPTKRTFKAIARLKMARLKRTVEMVAFNLAMAIIPMPMVAV